MSIHNFFKSLNRQRYLLIYKTFRMVQILLKNCEKENAENGKKSNQS